MTIVPFQQVKEIVSQISVQIPAAQVQQLIELIIELSEKGEIRHQNSMYSVFDVISSAAGKGNPRQQWNDLLASYPEVVRSVDNLQFGGAGQRKTPVAPLATCIEIIWLLPGEYSSKLRSLGAQMVSEIVEQAQVQQVPQEQDIDLLLAQMVLQSQQSHAALLAMQQARAEMREIQQQNLLLAASLQNVQKDVQEIKNRAEEASKNLTALPPSTKDVPSRTTRNNINTLVREYCFKNSTSHSDAWRNLYREFRDRYSIDLQIRASNGNCKPLDIAQTLDVLDDLYALAVHLFTEAA